MTDHSEATNEAMDSEARRRIREELDKNFMVEAAAGTGKTTSIVQRMVNLVASGACEIEHLVAVTFTRKAAAELRERFQAELRRRAVELQKRESEKEREAYLRLQSASDYVSHAFVGTIHSFCAALLRERPIEFGVDPTFRELDEEEDLRLREEAWHENITDLFATGDPLIDQIDEYGLDRKDLKSCFDRFIEYRDVEQWPYTEPPKIDVEDIKRQTRAYIDDMKNLLPLFPAERGNDKLMGLYEAIIRGRGKNWDRLGKFFQLMEKFDTSPGEVQSKWHDKQVAKQERDRFKEFRAQVAQPAMAWWCRKRYRFVVDFVRRAVQIYEREKIASGGLDFTDLLLIAAEGLKNQPELRQYFQGRFTHLLVDEFQDTDPIQAEMIMYLTSENVAQPEWHHCRPRPGSLFLVGDPKQSIYRFRRGDIVTYNRVKAIFEQSGGDVLSLVKNFRSRDEIRTWNNRVYQAKFLEKANQYTTAAEDMLTIATSDDHEIQRALTEAYEANDLRGKKLLTARRLIEKRRSDGKTLRGGTRKRKNAVSSKNLLDTYQKETARQRLLIQKSKLCETRLLFTVSAIRQLLEDENLVNLLRAESLDTMPAFLVAELESNEGQT